MTTELRNDIEAIYHAALGAVEPADAVRRNISIVDDALQIDGQRLALHESGIFAIAIGKAACQMTAGLAAAFGARYVRGIAITKAPCDTPPAHTRVLLGSHPVPDERSLQAGQAVLEFARQIPAGALVFCLISGGGSSLVEVLRPEVTLGELRRVTSALLKAGATISEMNAVRSRLSDFKGGGLLTHLRHAQVVNLIISDVLGDDPRSIASGPTVPHDGLGSAEDVLTRFGVTTALPEATQQDSALPLATMIVASVSTAVDAAAAAAARIGYSTHVISRSVDAEARDVGRVFASMVADTVQGKTSFERPCCILAGGETVVHIQGDGTGGRNTEAALSAALRLTGVPDCAIGFLATDGDDGTSGAAGGIVDGTTVGASARRAAIDALATNDSFPFLMERGGVLVTGPSGTNVNDLMIALIR